MLNRRRLMAGAVTSALTAAALGPRLSLAKADTERRLLVVVLRGAADGMALVPPLGEPGYAKLRGQLAIPATGSEHGAHRLDGLFGLHPACNWLAERYQAKQALMVHAVASPYRARSHFDGQDALENGTATALGLRDGWLNRALSGTAPQAQKAGRESAIALGSTIPLLLRGEQLVANWAPSELPAIGDDTLRRLASRYAEDEFLSERLSRALAAQALADGAGNGKARVIASARKQLVETLGQAARFLSATEGPRIAVVEIGGWDTHANQGAAEGSLANQFASLDDGLRTFQQSLGSVWASTAVLVVTEFGRTVRVNGTSGTDHGTGGVALLIGGGVAGGRVLADWPGLAERALYQGRDLMPTTDLRALSKAVLIEHLRLDAAFVDARVFPDSGRVAPLGGLFA